MGNTAFAQVSTIERINGIITDETADETEINHFLSFCITVDIVKI